MRNFNSLPLEMQTEIVKRYYEILNQKKGSLFCKRVLDLLLAFVVLSMTAIPMLAIAITIKLESKGPVFFRQERVTQYGKIFKIHKFRTMVVNADQLGTKVTSDNDIRITKAGRFLRKYRLDELPQVFDVISGDMTFVGTRPEVVQYVKQYKPEYYATLLLPAGITSNTSILFKDEAKLLNSTDDNNIDSVYINQILPRKMKINLTSLENFSLRSDIKTLFSTLYHVIR